MKFLYSISAIVTLFATLGNVSAAVDEQNTNYFRGLKAMSCKTDKDCYQPCTKTGCPKPKICYKNKCRNSVLFEKCNTNYCKLSRGETCCNESCGICTKKGEGCIKKLCLPPPPINCGKNICGKDEYCCNESCGICAPIDGACIALFCLPDPLPIEIECGNAICGKGQFCCNPSCNTCAPLGGACTQQFCDTPIISKIP